MLTSILTIVLGTYVVLVFVVNFHEGQYDCESDLKYSWISPHPRKTQDGWSHPKTTRLTPSTFSIEHSQQTRNKRVA
ncbi:hypothetical protein IQ235_10260 [Oscillatoriales cyanobacterium LEGE 11467]|uniref:Uncharacterized protein n=1 Tax=Zarconia navalis LEGE 11467 TaxID=1828826 RepID=A0A928W0Q8_9CYAN|nr:hypothetical protein [Zarconia navalis]MBE9041160.1 hypothetical protein [Zarconia navalis LEGE 11467]